MNTCKCILITNNFSDNKIKVFLNNNIVSYLIL